jgi:uncharacterized protein (DUF2235 family)
MSRNLVLCLDGTANKFGATNTNVVRVVQVIDRDDARQAVYYDPGVGTLPELGRLSKIRKMISMGVDMAFATTLTRNVEEAYIYLMNHWMPGDQVFLFGFSRGAYTARVLAGLLHYVGLLPRGSENLVPYAMRLLRAADKDETEEVGNGFRTTFAQPMPDDAKRKPADQRRFRVHFLSVWDTVLSVGWVWDPAKFRFTASNPSVDVIRQAIALDERRTFYRQNRFFKPFENPDQDLEQHWFAGVHSDVGGGYADSKIWRCSFDWMIAEATKAGLLVDPASLAALAPPITDPWNEKTHESLSGPLWWFCEYFPKLHYDRKKKRRELRLNRGRHRSLEPKEKIHRSLLQRIRGGYTPKNISPAFIQKVRSLPDVPDWLEYDG